jgi:hypothetical protein
LLQLLGVNNQFLSLLWGRFLLALWAQKRLVRGSQVEAL